MYLVCFWTHPFVPVMLFLAGAAPQGGKQVTLDVKIAEVSTTINRGQISNFPIYNDFQKLISTLPTPGQINAVQTGVGPAIPIDYGKLFGKDIGVNLSGNGINSVHAEVINKTTGSINFQLFPGTMFLSSDSKEQNMACVRPVNQMIGPWETKAFDIPSVCLDINSNPPTTMNRFTPALPLDFRIPSLCDYIGSRPRGPSSQGMMWIYTNGATIGQINDKLIPGITPGNYLNSLYNVWNIGRVDYSDESRAKCVSNDLISGALITPEATRWFVDFKGKTDPTGLIKTIDGFIPQFKDELTKFPADYNVRHFTDLAIALCENPNPDIRQCGIRLLTNAIPDASRPGVLKVGGQALIYQLLQSNDPKEILAGIDLIGLYKMTIPSSIFTTLQGIRPNGLGKQVLDRLPGLSGLVVEDHPAPEITVPTLRVRPADPRVTDGIWGVALRDPFVVELLIPRDMAMGMPNEIKVTFTAKDTGKSVTAILNNKASGAFGPVVYTTDHPQNIAGNFASVPGRTSITKVGPFDFTVEDFTSELHTKNGETVTVTCKDSASGLDLSTSFRVFDTRDQLRLGQFRESFDRLSTLYGGALNAPNINADGKNALKAKINLIRNAILWMDYKAADDEKFTDFTRIAICESTMSMLQTDPKTWNLYKEPVFIRPGIGMWSQMEWDDWSKDFRAGAEDWSTRWIRPMAQLTIEMYQFGVALTGADQFVMAVWGIDSMGNRVYSTDRFFAGVGLGSQLLLVGAGVAKAINAAEAGAGRLSKIPGLTNEERRMLIQYEQKAFNNQLQAADAARKATNAARAARAAGAGTNAAKGAGAVTTAVKLTDAEKWAVAVDRTPGLKSVEDAVSKGQKLSVNTVMDLKADPAAMRSLKTAPTNVRTAFNEVENGIYKVHDDAVVSHVKQMDTIEIRDAKGNVVSTKEAPWKGKDVKVQDFRTPGGDPNGINTDRDFRVVYQDYVNPVGPDGKPIAGPAKPVWIEVPRKYWDHFSTEKFAEVSGYSPEKVRAMASAEDIRAWDNWVQMPEGPTLDQSMKEKWAELHQQLATDKWHPEASIDFSDQVRNAIGQITTAQPNVLNVKDGYTVLKDAERFGMMYNEKADAYLRLKSELHPGGDKVEAMAQMNKGIDMLFDVRKGYRDLYNKFGQQAPIGDLSPRFTSACDAIKGLAPFDKTITPEKVANLEKVLDGLGFRGLEDFKTALDSQFTSLKAVSLPK